MCIRDRFNAPTKSLKYASGIPSELNLPAALAKTLITGTKGYSLNTKMDYNSDHKRDWEFIIPLDRSINYSNEP